MGCRSPQPFFSEKHTPPHQIMNSITSIRRSFGIVLLALCAFCAPVQAQALADMNKAAIDHMKAGEWAEAQAVLAKATDTYDGRALQLFGPRFGWFWYYRGYCEVKLKMYDDAIKSFDKCYTKYKNVAPKEGEAPSNNMYNKKSLLMWGHAAKGAGDWDTSIRMYEKFLKERDANRDTYEKGVFYINMAINNYKLKKIAEGNKFLETAIKGKVSFPTPNKGIMSAFSAMVAAVVDKKDEAALLDFLAKNRGHIQLEPFEAHEFSPLFMKLAQDARSAEMIRSTFELYSLVPSTTATINDIKARLQMVGSIKQSIRDGSMVVRKSDLTKSLEDLEKADALGKVNEIYAYLNTAVLHEEYGNTRGAFAVYEQLERYYPKAKIFRDGKVTPARENNLYNLVRTSAVIGEVFTTEHYGTIFLKAFPESTHAPDVRRMMLTSLFYNGEYDKCVEVAEPMLPTLTKPSQQHDICLFVLGGSKHYLAKFVEAQPLLNEYLDTYKKSKDADELRTQATSYFQAANYSRLQEWARSAALLDAFLKDYPDPKTNLYYPFALFDRANCHYAENEVEDAYTLVTRVETEFPGVSVMEQALALKGNVLEALKKPEEAEQYYLKALTLAEQKKNDLVASECLFYLTALVGKEKNGNEENPRMAEAVPYYAKFWDRYGATSPFKAKVAVAGIPAMRKAGKIEEALERLQGVIADLSKIPGTPGLEEAIGSYTEEYLKDHTPDQMKDHYYAFPRIDSRDMATRALLRIAIIDVFEGVYATADKEKDETKARNAKARVDVLFKELRDDFNPKDLSNFILVKVGNFIRKNTTKPEAARIYYEEALNRPGDQSHKFAAIFGLADVNAKGTKAQKTEAISLLKRVISDSDEASEREEASFLTASIYADSGEYDKAVAAATEYINNKSYRQFKVQARMLLGESHDKANRVDDALVSYQAIWSSSMGAIRYSAPAMKRWMEILWTRGGTNTSGKSDKQYAYEKGYEYIKLTENASKKAPADERAMREEVAELVKDYEANSETTPVVEPQEK
jgi:tetratricopeptide (TPR) repeat protein